MNRMRIRWVFPLGTGLSFALTLSSPARAHWISLDIKSPAAGSTINRNDKVTARHKSQDDNSICLGYAWDKSSVDNCKNTAGDDAGCSKMPIVCPDATPYGSGSLSSFENTWTSRDIVDHRLSAGAHTVYFFAYTTHCGGDNTCSQTRKRAYAMATNPPPTLSVDKPAGTYTVPLTIAFTATAVDPLHTNSDTLQVRAEYWKCDLNDPSSCPDGHFFPISKCTGKTCSLSVPFNAEGIWHVYATAEGWQPGTTTTIPAGAPSYQYTLDTLRVKTTPDPWTGWKNSPAQVQLDIKPTGIGTKARKHDWVYSDAKPSTPLDCAAGDATFSDGGSISLSEGKGWLRTCLIDNQDHKANDAANSVFQFWYDKTPPTVSARVPPLDGTNGWYKTKPTVTLTVADSPSGLDKVEYRWFQDSQNPPTAPPHDNTYIPLTSPYQITDAREGIWHLAVWARDVAGNETSPPLVALQSLKVDTTPPTVSFHQNSPTGPDAFSNSSVPDPFALYVDAADASPGSGLQSLHILITPSDGSRPIDKLLTNVTNNTLQDGPFYLGHDNTFYTVQLTATDGAGNINKDPNGETRTYTLNLSNYRPTLSASLPACCDTEPINYTWTNPANVNQIQPYELRWGNIPKDSDPVLRSNILPSDSQPLTLNYRTNDVTGSAWTPNFKTVAYFRACINGAPNCEYRAHSNILTKFTYAEKVAPSSVQAQNRTATSATITWNTGNNPGYNNPPGHPGTDYKLFYLNLTDPGETEQAVTLQADASHPKPASQDLSSLRSNTQFRLRVSALNGDFAESPMDQSP